MRAELEIANMLRAALATVLLAGLSTTAMASDRVRIVIDADLGGGYYYPVTDRYYYGDRYYGGRDYDRGYYYRPGRDYRYYDRGRYYGPRYYNKYPRRYYRDDRYFDHRYRGYRNYRENWGPRGKYYSRDRYR
jgi:hypothetical protein